MNKLLNEDKIQLEICAITTHVMSGIVILLLSYVLIMTLKDLKNAFYLISMLIIFILS